MDPTSTPTPTDSLDHAIPRDIDLPTSESHAAGTPVADADELLLTYLRERDANCPRCGYNLRNLTQPACPECYEELELRIGVPRLTMGWLFASLVPGSACAVAVGIFVFAFISLGPPPGTFPIELILTMIFMATSAATAILLATKHRSFLRLQNSQQAMACMVIWAIHIVAFAVFWNTV